jgi:hypothetical protein
MDYSDLKMTANLLIGRPCWLIIAGKGTGSIVHLGFGDKYPRDKPLKNPCINDDEKLFKPELSLMVYCAWRLSSLDRILCGWRSSNEMGGEMISGLSLLRFRRINDVSIRPLTLDLDLTFEDNICFQVFCDITTNDEEDNNYVLLIKDKIIEVGIPSSLAM